MFGPMGPMMQGWAQMWQWMWQMHLASTLLVGVVLALVVAGVALVASRRPTTPTTPKAG